jgi:hypothetical protein
MPRAKCASPRRRSSHPNYRAIVRSLEHRGGVRCLCGLVVDGMLRAACAISYSLFDAASLRYVLVLCFSSCCYFTAGTLLCRKPLLTCSAVQALHSTYGSSVPSCTAIKADCDHLLLQVRWGPMRHQPPRQPHPRPLLQPHLAAEEAPQAVAEVQAEEAEAEIACLCRIST